MGDELRDRPFRGFAPNQAISVFSYCDLFGERVSMDQLVTMLSRYPVEDWLTFLSRVATAIAPPFHYDSERFRRAFFGVLSKDIQARFDAAVKRSNLPVSHRPFSYAQIRVLQELAILHAPATSEHRIVDDADFDVFGRALFATWDLMHVPDAETGNHIGAMLHSYAREPHDTASEIATRAFHLFGVGQDVLNPHAEKLADWFLAATGQRLFDYLEGGLLIATLEEQRSDEELANGWAPTPHGHWIEVEEVRGRIDAYHAIRCAPIDRVRDTIQAAEQGREIWKFSGLGLARFPIVEFPERGRFILNHADIAWSLIEGVRDLLVASADAREIDGVNSSSQIGVEYGELFEDYVSSVVMEALPKRFRRLNSSKHVPTADLMIDGSNIVVVGEAKSAQLKRSAMASWIAVEDWEHGLAGSIGKAADQIASTIRAMQHFESPFDRDATRDWTATTIVPVVVTNASLPQFPGAQRIYERLSEPLQSVPLPGMVADLRIINVGDVEDFVELSAQSDINGLLLRWSRCPETRHSSFMNFRERHQLATPGEWHKRRFCSMLRHAVGLQVSRALDELHEHEGE